MSAGVSGKETGVRYAALALAGALAIAGCGGDGSPAAPASPPPPPPATPQPPPPATPTVTRIGFVDESAVLVEGGSVRALVMAEGRPLLPEHGPLEEKLALRADAPGDRLVWTSTSRALGIHAFEIESPPGGHPVHPQPRTLHLVETDGGLPPGIALDPDRTVFRVTVRNLEPEDCSDLTLTASRVRSHARRDQWGSNGLRSRGTAEVRFQGPSRAALRIAMPYFGPYEGSALAVLNPTSLPYQPVGGGGHRQAVSVNWFNQLELTAFLPGCEEVPLRE